MIIIFYFVLIKRKMGEEKGKLIFFVAFIAVFWFFTTGVFIWMLVLGGSELWWETECNCQCMIETYKYNNCTTYKENHHENGCIVYSKGKEIRVPPDYNNNCFERTASNQIFLSIVLLVGAVITFCTGLLCYTIPLIYIMGSNGDDGW